MNIETSSASQYSRTNCCSPQPIVIQVHCSPRSKNLNYHNGQHCMSHTTIIVKPCNGLQSIASCRNLNIDKDKEKFNLAKKKSQQLFEDVKYFASQNKQLKRERDELIMKKHNIIPITNLDISSNSNKIGKLVDHKIPLFDSRQCSSSDIFQYDDNSSKTRTNDSCISSENLVDQLNNKILIKKPLKESLLSYKSEPDLKFPTESNFRIKNLKHQLDALEIQVKRIKIQNQIFQKRLYKR